MYRMFFMCLFYFSCVWFIYEAFVQKKLLFDGVESALQCVLINRRKLLSEFLVNHGYHFCAGGVTFTSEGRHFSAYSTAIGGIVSSFHQAVRFQAVHQLGDIGADTGELPSQLAQAEWLACRHQRGQCSELRARQIHGRQGLFEASLDAVGGMNQ